MTTEQMDWMDDERRRENEEHLRRERYQARWTYMGAFRTRVALWWGFRRRPRYRIELYGGQPWIYPATGLLDVLWPHRTIRASLQLEEWLDATVEHRRAF